MGNTKVLLVLIFSALSAHAANNAGLTLLTEYDCGCPGQNVSYVCTVVGGIFTVWAGSAFSCPEREITLRHTNNFQMTTPDDCNNGAIIIVARGIQNVGNCYTSQLDVRLSNELQGENVTCSREDSNVELIGSATLMVSSLSDPPPPPELISVYVDVRQLVFSWEEVEFNCSTLKYSCSSSPGCGQCLTNSTTATCTEFNALSGVNNYCRFNVSSMVCGNITGPPMTTMVNLKVPDAPFIKSIPSYLNDSTDFKRLIRLSTKFSLEEAILIAKGINGSADNFTITYSDTTDGNTCISSTLLVSSDSCIDRICSHDITINSTLCPSESNGIMVTVYVTNVLGRSNDSNVVTIDGFNNFVNVRFNSAQKKIVCNFLNQPIAIMKQCIANVTYGDNCDQILNIFEGKSTGNAVSTTQLERAPDVTEYCFIVTAISTNKTVMVEGKLVNKGSRNPTSNKITVLVVLLVLVLQ